MRFVAPSASLVFVLLLVAVATGCDGDSCQPHTSTFCSDGATYWMNSCGGREELVETCDCGCAADSLRCKTCDCEPVCDGKSCGPDGCGGSCGACDTGEQCGADGTCSPCIPACGGKQCGPNGCGGTCAPGCGAGEACTPAGLCEACEPQCTGRECGDDGCGGTCPPGCDEGFACFPGGICEQCTPDCAGRTCGDDGCGGSCAPGCEAGERCTEAGQCVGCVRDCAGRFCGDDGCGATCGDCAAGLECSEAGQCLEPVCGDVPVAIDGSFRNDVADVAFDSATVLVEHKRDIDEFEDGCITRVEIRLGVKHSEGVGCQLDVVAAGRYDVDGGLEVQSVRFAADSFCLGFADADEGEYSGVAELERRAVVPGVTEVPGRTVAESCVDTTFTVRLKGTVFRADGEELEIGATTIAIGGEFTSTGDTESSCPCRPDCEGRTCGEDGCGDVCGACEGDARCTDDGQCLVRPVGACWDDGAWRQKVAPALGEVVVTEIMANPAAVGDDAGEWFELWLARDIDANGLSIARAADGTPDLAIPEGECSALEGGRHLLLARSSNPDTNGGLPDVDLTFGFALTNSNGALVVGYEGTLLDAVTWTSVPNGASRSLDPLGRTPTLNDQSVFWCEADPDDVYGLGDLGTPGRTNASCGVALPTCTDDGVMRDKILPDVGDLVISEFMADPSAASDADGEWFEVYVARDVDLNGLQLGRDSLVAEPVFPEGPCRRVTAGTRLLFAKRADGASNGGLPPVDATFGFSLVNSNGALRVGVAGEVLDAITWSSSRSGEATQLDPDSHTPTGNDDAGNWCFATAAYGGGDLGTPGAGNANCP